MAPLQQIIEAMVQPLGIVWILSLIGLVANLLKRRWLTVIAFGAIAVLMFVFGSTRVPLFLLARLERPYAAGAGARESEGEREREGSEREGRSSEVRDRRSEVAGRESQREGKKKSLSLSLRSDGTDAVVMLGGMASRSANDATGMDVSDGFDRFLTAAELLRRNAAPRLLLGGGGNRRIGSRQRSGSHLHV